MRPAAAPRPEPATLVEALAVAAAGDDGLTFVRGPDDASALSWRDLQGRARRCAGGLAAAGVAAGERVALVLPTGPDFPVALCGALLAGAVPVPLYPPVRLGRLAEYHAATAAMLAAVDAQLVVTTGPLRGLLGPALAKLGPPRGACTVGDLARRDGGCAAHVAAPEDLALVQFSSGTTRAPRPVALTHAALMAQCAALHPLLRGADGTPQRGVSWLPLYHDMGLIGALIGALTFPGPLTLIPPERFLADPALWLRTIAAERATISPAPPFAFALCARRIRDEELDGCDLSTWRLAITGAEPVAPAVLERFADRFARWGFRAATFAPAYGLAEAALAVTCSPPGRGAGARGVDLAQLAVGRTVPAGTHAVADVGEPLAGVRVEIRDDAGKRLPDDRYGHIHVRGPALMRGYLDQPEATAAVLQDGWLATGDLGFVADGRLFVVGRAKDIVVIRGANHRPEEFESCLADLPGVRPGRVIAASHLPDDGEGEELLLLVERARGASAADDGDLAAAVGRRVRSATGVRPGRVVVVAPGTLLRTSSGKLRRAETLRRHRAGTLAPPGRARGLALAGPLLRAAWGMLQDRWRP